MLDTMMSQDHNYRSTQDYIIIAVSGVVMIQAHIVIGVYTFSDRYKIFGVCEHETPTFITRLVTLTSILLLPILFSFLAVEHFYELKITDRNTKDFDEEDLDINQFQDMMRAKQIRASNELEGGIIVKCLEGSLESYWQFFVMNFAINTKKF